MCEQSLMQDKPQINLESQRANEVKIAKIVDNALKSFNEQISQEEFEEVLKQLRFIHGKGGKAEEIAMLEMWKMLQTENRVDKQTLKGVLVAVLGGAKSDKRAISVQKKFGLFKTNRFSTSPKSVRYDSEQAKLFTFSPKVNTVSALLAESARKKILHTRLNSSQADNNTSNMSNSQSLPDLLIYSKLVMDEYSLLYLIC